MRKDAKFSDCGKYRYWLHREWDEQGLKAMCIGLNPSTANATEDDPTIRNLIRILHHEGFGSLYMLNLFALISPNPEDLRVCPDPVRDNDYYLIKYGAFCDAVIFCWGQFPMAAYRARKIAPMFPDAICFGKNGNGSPRHPLYLRHNVGTMKFNHSKNIYV